MLWDSARQMGEPGRSDYQYETLPSLQCEWGHGSVLRCRSSRHISDLWGVWIRGQTDLSIWAQCVTLLEIGGQR